MKLVYVKWLDSSLDRGWTTLSDYKPTYATHESIGWVPYEDSVILSVCGHKADETETTAFQGAGIINIPKIAIISVKELDDIK